jgi:hypothetical protein
MKVAEQLDELTQGPPSEEYLKRLETMKGIIKTFWIENCYGPSVRDLTQELGYRTTSVTLHWLRQMTRRGDILFGHTDNDTQRAMKNRSIRLPNMTISFTESSKDNTDYSRNSNIAN